MLIRMFAEKKDVNSTLPSLRHRTHDIQTFTQSAKFIPSTKQCQADEKEIQSLQREVAQAESKLANQAQPSTCVLELIPRFFRGLFISSKSLTHIVIVNIEERAAAVAVGHSFFY